MSTTALTGATRHRVHRSFGKNLLVLQVELTVVGENVTNDGGRVESRPYEYTIWRDATVEDFSVLPLPKKGVPTS